MAFLACFLAEWLGTLEPHPDTTVGNQKAGDSKDGVKGQIGSSVAEG